MSGLIAGGRIGAFMASKAGRNSPHDASRAAEVAAELSDVIYSMRLEPDPAFEYVSPSVTALVGYTPEEHYADPLLGSKLLDPRDAEILAEAAQAPMGETVEFTVRWRAKDGHTVWTAHRCRTQLRDDGAVVLYGAARDVTAEHDLAEQLADVSAQLGLVLNNTADVLGRLGPDGTLLWVSPSIRTVFGWDPADIVGTPFRLSAPHFRQQMQDALAKAVDEHADHYAARLQVVCADGELRWADATNTLVWKSSGELDSVVVALRDVSEQVAAHNDAVASGRRFRSLLEVMPDPTFVFSAVRDDDGDVVDLRYTQLNAAAARLYQRNPEEVLGRGILELFPVTKEVGAFDLYVDSLQSGESRTMRIPWLDQNGVAGSFDVTTSVLGDELVVVARDVTIRAALEQQRAAMMESMLDPHVLLRAVRDQAGTIVDFVYAEANAAACTYMLMAADELVGARLLDLLPGQAASGMLALYAHAVESGDPLVLDDYAYPHEVLKDERRYDIRAVRVGEALSFTWRDVSDRHRQVEALTASEARYRLLAENATDVVLLINPEQNLTWVSPATRTVLGYDPESLLGTNTAELIHPDDLPGLASLRVGQVEGETVARYRIRVLDSDGEYRWMSGLSRAALDPEGETVGRIATLRDIQSQVLAEQGLQQSEHRYRMLAENASDAVAELTPDFSLVWASPSLRSALGWRPEQVVGLNITELIHPDDRALDSRWRESMASGAGPPMELRALTGDGSYRWVSVRLRAITAADGSLQGWVSGLRDVHEQVLARQALANSQRRYKMLAENASDVVWQLDADTVLRWVAPSIESVLGWVPEELLGRPAIELVHPADLPALSEWRSTVFAGEPMAPFEVRLRQADGDFRWMSLHTRSTTQPDGQVDGAVVNLRDVHEQVIAREKLARSEAMFRLAMDGAPQGMAVVGLHGRFLRVNDALCDLLGRDGAWLLEHDEYDVIHDDDLANDQAARDRLLARHAEYDMHEGRLVTASDEPVWVQHSLALVRDEHDMPLFYVSQYQDITSARASRRALQYRAEHDALTGLINRYQLQEHLDAVLARQPRAVGIPGLLFCDLDHFKTVNDSYGHASGDYLLRVVAERIESALREGDEVARLGGDEFVVVLPEVASTRAAIGVAEKIRSAVARPLHVGKDTITITVSVGLALATPGVKAHPLLRNADVALYEAKETGRDRIAVFDPTRRPDCDST